MQATVIAQQLSCDETVLKRRRDEQEKRFLTAIRKINKASDTSTICWPFRPSKVPIRVILEKA